MLLIVELKTYRTSTSSCFRFSYRMSNLNHGPI